MGLVVRQNEPHLSETLISDEAGFVILISESAHLGFLQARFWDETYLGSTIKTVTFWSFVWYQL